MLSIHSRDLSGNVEINLKKKRNRERKKEKNWNKVQGAIYINIYKCRNLVYKGNIFVFAR